MRLGPKQDAGGGARKGAGQITPDLAPAGFMTREERKKFENLNSSYNKYWVPCVWFCNLAAQARREGRIRDNGALKLLLEVGYPGSHSLKKKKEKYHGNCTPPTLRWCHFLTCHVPFTGRIPNTLI